MADESTTTTEAPEKPEAATEQQSTESATETEVLGDAGKQAIDRMKAERNEANKRVRALEQELQQFREATMSEQEKALEAARNEARAEAFRASAPERVRLAFEAVAGSRMTAEQIDEFLEDVDTTKYLTDEGAVDRERVAKKVDALAPAKQEDDDKSLLFPDLGQGKRPPAAPSNDPRAADLAQIEADLAAAKRR